MAKKKNTNEYRIREHEPNLETAEQMLTNIFEAVSYTHLRAHET